MTVNLSNLNGKLYVDAFERPKSSMLVLLVSDRYIPTIPMVLVNGSEGIGTGKVRRRKPKLAIRFGVRFSLTDGRDHARLEYIYSEL